MGESAWRVDNEKHLLQRGGRFFRCDLDVEAVRQWKGHALLLSSDTDCLSLWDEEGLIRLARVGVYPQDVVVAENTAIVCGGADGMLHLLSLPDLHEMAAYPVPGMPERLCQCGDLAYVLSLMSEPEVHTMLLAMELANGTWRELRQLSGIPEAITADETGLWIAVSEGAIWLPHRELST